MRSELKYLCAKLFVASAMTVGAAPAYAADAPMHVEVSLGDVSINKVPFLIAADSGIYAKNGLDVHQFITPGAAAEIGASGVHVPAEFVGSKEASAAAPIDIGGGEPTIGGISRNPDAKLRVIVSTTEDIFRAHLISTPTITSLQDMKGKRISGVGDHYYGMVMVARKEGWQDGKDITLLDHDQNIAGLNGGKTDGIAAPVMVWSMVGSTPYKDVGDLAQFNIPMAGSSIMVESKFLAANHELVARFVKATVEATALMKKNRKLFNAAVVKWFNVTDPKVQASMYDEVKVIPDKPYPTKAGIEGAVQFHDSPLLRKYKAQDFYDMSFIADLDKSGYLDKLAK